MCVTWDAIQDLLIKARGGTWRGDGYGASQTLNEQKGGQGDPWTTLCGLALQRANAAAQ